MSQPAKTFDEMCDLITQSVCVRCGQAKPCACDRTVITEAAARAKIWDEVTPGEFVLKDNLSPRQVNGWICPKCGAIWGPQVAGCERCNGEPK